MGLEDKTARADIERCSNGWIVNLYSKLWTCPDRTFVEHDHDAALKHLIDYISRCAEKEK